jgi:hypothetical protein
MEMAVKMAERVTRRVRRASVAMGGRRFSLVQVTADDVAKILREDQLEQKTNASSANNEKEEKIISPMYTPASTSVVVTQEQRLVFADVFNNYGVVLGKFF